MRGTVMCGVKDSEEARAALELATKLSAELDLRLVLAHVVDSPPSEYGAEGLTARLGREGAARLLARMAAEYGVAGSADRREAVGERAEELARIAAEESADLIVLGSRSRGRLRLAPAGGFVSELQKVTPVPVVIAPPRRRPRGRRAAVPPRREEAPSAS